MKFDHVFRQIDTSESLIAYAEEHLQNVCKFLLKDGSCSIHYYMHKKDYSIEIMVHTADNHFKAKSSSDSFYSAVDEVCAKLEIQFLKKKKRSQHHKNFEKSKQGRFEHLNEKLEYEYGDDYFRKAL